MLWGFIITIPFSFSNLQPPQFLANPTPPAPNPQPSPLSRQLPPSRQGQHPWPPPAPLLQPPHKASYHPRRKPICPFSLPPHCRWKRREEPPNCSCSRHPSSSACLDCSSRYRYDLEKRLNSWYWKVNQYLTAHKNVVHITFSNLVTRCCSGGAT